MASNPGSRALHWPAGSLQTGVIAGLMHALAALFKVTAPIERELITHRLLLLAIVGIGCFVRFWGLGNVGLHGDEETMAMATMHIVNDGLPILPSGMFYPRGLTELYLMAFSVQLFGESEWAFRLPSAICGVLLIVLAYMAGRRFLRPQWNLALAATIALLPDLIEYSQTARMYIFLLTSVAACLVCVFAWERSNRIGWLIGAVVLLVIGIELHALAVTTLLVFALPGLLQGDWRKLLYGGAAGAVVFVAYLFISGWQDAQYPVPPPEYAADLGPPPWDRGRAAQGFDLTFTIALWVAGIAVALFALHLGRIIPKRLAAISVVVALLAGLLAQLLLHYHVAGLMFLTGVVLARRYGGPRVWRRLWIFALGCGLLALLHLTLLAASPGSLMKLVGAVVGQPSVWPYVRITEFSRFGAVVSVAALLWGLWQLATRRPTTDYWLLAVLGVWIPMFALGLFVWNMPSRYAAASLLPLLLCAFAFAQYCVDWLKERIPRISSRVVQGISAVAITALILNPMNVLAGINRGYESYPDHVGAAEFMRTQNIKPEDVVLAEDVLQQTYYLGSVDYWLISRAHARRFVELRNGKVRDFYTGTPLIDSRKVLEDLLQRERNHRIFIIGSGENQADKRRGMRGDMNALMLSDRFIVVWAGRDGFTKVWQAAPVAAGPAADTAGAGSSQE